MAQTFPTSAQIVYDTLTSDTEILDRIGTYSFKAGSESKAISIVSPGEDLPSIRNVSGLECVIQDTGPTTQQLYYNKVDTIVTWNVFLVCWEPEKGANLQGLTELILKRFLGSSASQVVGTTDGIGSLVQNKIMIQSNMPILEA